MVELSLLVYSLWLVITAVLATLQFIRFLKWIFITEEEVMKR